MNSIKRDCVDAHIRGSLLLTPVFLCLNLTPRLFCLRVQPGQRHAEVVSRALLSARLSSERDLLVLLSRAALSSSCGLL